MTLLIYSDFRNQGTIYRIQFFKIGVNQQSHIYGEINHISHFSRQGYQLKPGQHVNSIG